MKSIKKRPLTAAEIKSAITRMAARQGCVFSKDVPWRLRNATLEMMKRDVSAYKDAYELSPRTVAALDNWIANLGTKWVW